MSFEAGLRRQSGSSVQWVIVTLAMTPAESGRRLARIGIEDSNRATSRSV